MTPSAPVIAPTPNSKAPERFAHRLWRRVGRPLFVILIFTWIIRSSLADWRDVPSGSMEPTIQPGDRILVNKLAYGYQLPLVNGPVKHTNEPMVGDVIVFRLAGSHHTMVKCVIAVAGDSVEIIDRVVYRNGVAATYENAGASNAETPMIPLEQRPAFETIAGIRHAVQFDDAKPRNPNFPRGIVPPDHVFLLGDNRDHSTDGRILGFIHRDQILGKVYSVAFSIDTRDGFRLRGDRWFKRVE